MTSFVMIFGLPRPTPYTKKWIKSIVNQCHNVGVPVFVKQLGSVHKNHQILIPFLPRLSIVSGLNMIWRYYDLEDTEWQVGDDYFIPHFYWLSTDEIAPIKYPFSQQGIKSAWQKSAQDNGIKERIVDDDSRLIDICLQGNKVSWGTA